MSDASKAPHWPCVERMPDGVEYRVRPIRRDDAARERDFIRGLSETSRFQRFMHTIREPTDEFIAQLVDIDTHQRMALVAVIGEASEERIIGVARYAADEGGVDCEFGVAVGDAWQCRGIGTTLARLLIDHAAREGFRTIYGHVLGDNRRMIELAEWLGLQVEPGAVGETMVRVSRRLN